jgi:hypothetical protein
MRIGAALRRLFRRRESEDHPLSAKERETVSEGFFDERAKALGPDAYDHVDVDREFRRPS